jgi:hypothetical protein
VGRVTAQLLLLYSSNRRATRRGFRSRARSASGCRVSGLARSRSPGGSCRGAGSAAGAQGPSVSRPLLDRLGQGRSPAGARCAWGAQGAAVQGLGSSAGAESRREKRGGRRERGGGREEAVAAAASRQEARRALGLEGGAAAGPYGPKVIRLFFSSSLFFFSNFEIHI